MFFRFRSVFAAFLLKSPCHTPRCPKGSSPNLGGCGSFQLCQSYRFPVLEEFLKTPLFPFFRLYRQNMLEDTEIAR